MLKNFAFLVFVITSPAFAHQHHPAVKVDFARSKLEIQEAQIQNLIDQSHDVIEGDESGGFFARWKSAFNFKARFVDGYRLSSSLGDNRFRDLAIDSLFLFGLSHSTEMLSGPILLGVGAAHHWPNWVMGLISGGGVLTSIPGLDPLCIVVFTFYKKNPGFRGAVGWLRLATVKSVNAVGRTSGWNDYVARTFARPELRGYLENIEGLSSAVIDEDGSVDFHYEFGMLSLIVHFENGSAYLEEVRVSGEREQLKARDYKTFTRQFGWNAHDFIKSFLREPKMEKPYLVESSPEHARLAPNAIGIKAKRDCGSRLL